jgi:hypothetical protein
MCCLCGVVVFFKKIKFFYFELIFFFEFLVFFIFLMCWFKKLILKNKKIYIILIYFQAKTAMIILSKTF